MMERKTGRVVRIDIEEGYSKWMLSSLLERWSLRTDSVFMVKRASMIDFTGLWQIVGNKRFKERLPQIPDPVKPLSYPEEGRADIFEVLKERDILLH